MSDLEVAIIVPIYKKNLSKNETLSLKRCFSVLAKYPLIFIHPEGLNIDLYKELSIQQPHISFEQFDSEYFHNTQTYNQLLISKKLYLTFIKYSYILIYQLDAYVFEDRLEEWCEKGYDYIGAPWFENFSNNSQKFWHVGNGGFSLKNVNSHLKVLNSINWVKTSKFELPYYNSNEDSENLLIKYFAKILRKIGFSPAQIIIKNFYYNEDVFWSFFASIINPDFKVAPISEALSFSFETNPSFCFEQNQKKLPFGCHAWMKYEPEFWSQFIKINN